MSITSKLKNGYALIRVTLSVIPQLIKIYHNRNEFRELEPEINLCEECGRLDLCENHADKMDELL